MIVLHGTREQRFVDGTEEEKRRSVGRKIIEAHYIRKERRRAL